MPHTDRWHHKVCHEKFISGMMRGSNFVQTAGRGEKRIPSSWLINAWWQFGIRHGRHKNPATEAGPHYSHRAPFFFCWKRRYSTRSNRNVHVPFVSECQRPSFDPHSFKKEEENPSLKIKENARIPSEATRHCSLYTTSGKNFCVASRQPMKIPPECIRTCKHLKHPQSPFCVCVCVCSRVFAQDRWLPLLRRIWWD